MRGLFCINEFFFSLLLVLLLSCVFCIDSTISIVSEAIFVDGCERKERLKKGVYVVWLEGNVRKGKEYLIW